MSELPRVKIISPENSFFGTKIYIDDNQIKKVTSIDFHIETNEVPTFTFETLGMPDIDMMADVRFSFTPKTVEEAVKVLRNELLKHTDFYNGFLASIESSVKEQQPSLPYRNSKFISEEILKRIIGEG